MLMLTADIAERLGAGISLRSLESKPNLCWDCHLRSVFASSAIEGKALSLDNVTDIITGRKKVPCAQEDIQEVQNLYRAYEMLGQFDPYSFHDLKKINAVMTGMTAQSPELFRSTNGTVFNGEERIFNPPPPQEISGRLDALFGWLISNRGQIHPLILSTIFHFELYFIFPFSEGNGYMARLWQMAILSDWKPLFRHIPVESEIYRFLGGYYHHFPSEMNSFIEFMLDKINLSVAWIAKQIMGDNTAPSRAVQKLLHAMEQNVSYSALQLMELLNLTSRSNFWKLYLNPALEQGLIMMSVPDKPTSKNQMYIKC